MCRAERSMEPFEDVQTVLLSLVDSLAPAKHDAGSNNVARRECADMTATASPEVVNRERRDHRD